MASLLFVNWHNNRKLNKIIFEHNLDPLLSIWKLRGKSEKGLSAS